MSRDLASAARVVVVASEALIGEELRTRLTGLHYDVVAVADTGERALAAVERLRPDLALVDVALTEYSGGANLAESIRARWGVPVVLLVTHPDHSTRALARADDVRYVLAPFTERHLLVAIEVTLHCQGLEQHLETCERRCKTALDLVTDSVIATSPGGRVTFINAAAQALTGWSSGDAIDLPSHHIAPLLDERRGVVLSSPIDQANQSMTAVHSTEPALLICHDGSVVPVDFTASPVAASDGHLLGAVLAIRARQERIAAEALRTAEAELHQAQKMEAIGRLAAGIAHDFNSILTIIAGDSEIALDDGVPRARVKELLAEIGEASARGTSLTRNLLAFSRKQDAHSRPVGVNEAIDHATRLVSRVLGRRIAVELRLDESAGKIVIDPTQLEIVLLNLAANARDAMPEGGTLIISTRAVEASEDSARPGMPAGRYIVIDVEDQGSGMSASVASRVFEPFFTTKDDSGGTGIGLSTVYNIVKRFGGFVYVQTAEGVGSRFSIFVPPADQTEAGASESDRSQLLG